MTTHYRRRTPSRLDELGAVSVSLLVGLGGAAVAYYLTRLYLSREKLEGSQARAPGEPGEGAPIGRLRRSRLPAPGGTAGEGG